VSGGVGHSRTLRCSVSRVVIDECMDRLSLPHRASMETSCLNGWASKSSILSDRRGLRRPLLNCHISGFVQLVVSRRLRRQVGWLVALGDGAVLVGRAPGLADEIRTLGDQTARGGEVAFIVDRRGPLWFTVPAASSGRTGQT
jgi:hypothetical protein